MRKNRNPNPSGRAGRPISLAPLTPDQALAGLLKISKTDVEEIKREAKPSRKGKKK